MPNAINFSSFATAASRFSGRMQENQGVWEFRRGFLYQIYDRELRIWGCDVANYLKIPKRWKDN